MGIYYNIDSTLEFVKSFITSLKINPSRDTSLSMQLENIKRSIIAIVDKRRKRRFSYTLGESVNDYDLLKAI